MKMIQQTVIDDKHSKWNRYIHIKLMQTIPNSKETTKQHNDNTHRCADLENKFKTMCVNYIIVKYLLQVDENFMIPSCNLSCKGYSE